MPTAETEGHCSGDIGYAPPGNPAREYPCKLPQFHASKLAAHLLRRYMQNGFQVRPFDQNSFDSSK
jgi:hypothetical protein